MEASPPPPAGYDPSRYGDYPYGPLQPGPYPYGPPQKRGGLPAWAIVLIVVAVVGPIVAGIFAAIAIPAFVTQHDKAQDSSVKEGAHLIRIGIESWAADNGGVYPQLGDVSPEGGIAPYVDPWPINPWTDAAMQPGTQRGDYRYVPAPDGSDYELLVFLSDGQALKIH